MKRSIFPTEGRFYKANLHCHSTLSDGHLSPEELKALYKGAGYSILAYSDHNVLVDHSELSDEDFLAMSAVEIDVNKRGEEAWEKRPCYHVNFFPRDPHATVLPCYNPKYVWGKNQTELRDNQLYIGTPDFRREYDDLNVMLEEFARNGFLAMLNHPTWSRQTMEDYRALKAGNIFAMELYNNSCYVMGYDEINTHVFDELLCHGHRIFGTACDDNHNKSATDSPYSDSLGGFVMIKAASLTQEAVWDALKAGQFYASTGPLIEELYIEDETLVVKTSPAVRVALTTGVRQARAKLPEGGAKTITEARFDLSRVWPGYIRLTVTDAEGRCAWSQPIFGEFSGRTK